MPATTRNGTPVMAARRADPHDVARDERHHSDLRLHLHFDNLEPFISEKSAHGRDLDRKLEQARAEASHHHTLSR